MTLDQQLAHARTHGITSISQLRALLYIARADLSAGSKLATATAVASHIGLSTAALTGILDNLELLSLIERTHSANDRRRISLSLTALGHAVASELEPRALATA